jgi:hypothetical protein
MNPPHHDDYLNTQMHEYQADIPAPRVPFDRILPARASAGELGEYMPQEDLASAADAMSGEIPGSDPAADGDDEDVHVAHADDIEVQLMVADERHVQAAHGDDVETHQGALADMYAIDVASVTVVGHDDAVDETAITDEHAISALAQEESAETEAYYGDGDEVEAAGAEASHAEAHHIDAHEVEDHHEVAHRLEAHELEAHQEAHHIEAHHVETIDATTHAEHDQEREPELRADDEAEVPAPAMYAHEVPAGESAAHASAEGEAPVHESSAHDIEAHDIEAHAEPVHAATEVAEVGAAERDETGTSAGQTHQEATQMADTHEAHARDGHPQDAAADSHMELGHMHEEHMHEGQSHEEHAHEEAVQSEHQEAAGAYAEHDGESVYEEAPAEMHAGHAVAEEHEVPIATAHDDATGVGEPHGRNGATTTQHALPMTQAPAHAAAEHLSSAMEARGMLESVAQSLRTLAGRDTNGEGIAIFPRGVDVLEVRMHISRERDIDLNFRVAGPTVSTSSI